MLLRDTIFVVQKNPDVRADLRKILEGQFNILEADSLEQADLLFRDNQDFIVAALLDMELLEDQDISRFPWVHQAAATNLFPAIAIVGAEDVKNEHRAYELGADEVIFRPIHPLSTERRINNLVGHYRVRWALEEKVEEQTAALSHTNTAVVDTLASVIEYRSVESGMHTLRIRRFTQILLTEVAACCPEYELDERQIQSIASAAALHDLGKIAIPDAILNKPGRLTPEEYAIMKTHSALGSEMLARMGTLVDESYMRYAYNICRYHHERWDGNGYPEDLIGDQIPICAQVVGLADCYDALTTDRVYKKACSCAEAANMIMNGECGLFSPVLLECFKSVRGQMEVVAGEYADGLSPKNDAVVTPMAPPIVTATDSLQRLMDKYSMLLRHTDATVVEVDLGKKTYHVSYYADPDLDFIIRTDEKEVSASRWRLNMFDPDGSELSSEAATERLRDFLVSGVRRRDYPILMRGQDGTFCPYEMTLMRPEARKGDQRLTVIYKRKGRAEAPPSAGVAGAPIRDGVLALFQRCAYDRWLTMSRVGAELLRLTGYTEEEIRERYHCRLAELIPEGERETVMETLSRQLVAGNLFQVSLPLQGKSGKVWVEAKGILSTGEGGGEYLDLLLTDVSHVYGELSELRRTLDRQELIVSQSSDVVFELDLMTDRLVHIGKWKERFGYTPIMEQVMTNLERNSHFHPDDTRAFRYQFELLRGGKPHIELTVRVVDSTGHYRWNRVRAALQRDEHGRPVKAAGVFIDIDNEKRAAWALQESARRDALTHLLNKNASRQEITDHLARRETDALAVLAIIDLDNFKLVNDQYGHLFGDAVLSRVSTEISRMFRGGDVVGRIGGDEFMVFLPEIPSQKMATDRFQLLCDAVRKALSEYPVDGQLSCSIGLAFAPDHGLTYEDLFRRADRALYQSKSSGKGGYSVFSPATEAEAFPTAVSKRIDSDNEPGVANGSLAQYVFEALYESGDTLGTIRSLLEMVGRQAGVSRVYIFENNEDNTTCSNTFEWCSEGISAEIDNLQNLSYEEDLSGFRESYNEFGILYAPDVRELPPQVRDILEPQGIKSVLHCAILDQGVFRGYVGFDDNNMIRLWTQEQIDLLTFLSQILSIFLLKHRTQERTEAMAERLKQSLKEQR